MYVANFSQFLWLSQHSLLDVYISPWRINQEVFNHLYFRKVKFMHFCDVIWASWSSSHRQTTVCSTIGSNWQQQKRSKSCITLCERNPPVSNDWLLITYDFWKRGSKSMSQFFHILFHCRITEIMFFYFICGLAIFGPLMELCSINESLLDHYTFRSLVFLHFYVWKPTLMDGMLSLSEPGIICPVVRMVMCCNWFVFLKCA